MKLQVKSVKLEIDRRRLLYLAVFVILGIIALQIPVNVLEGAKVKFTLFDLFAPLSGAFLGGLVGVFAVILMQLANVIFHGFSGIQTDSILKLVATFRFLPLIFGVLYFALKNKKNDKWILVIPLLSIAAFILHPIGRTVWFYSLFWLIPVVVWPLRNRFLVARSLGSTFTAHAIGGAVWIWAFNMPAAVWVCLIPIVILERSIFARGISASYILVNNVLGYVNSMKVTPVVFKVDRKYVLKVISHKS